MFWESVVGRNIRVIRKERGTSQEQLAHTAGIDLRYLGGIERGEFNPTVAVLGQIAEALDVNPSVFFNYAADE